MALLRHPHLFTGEWWARLFESGRRVLLPYVIGGMMLSVVCSLAAYPLTLRFLRAKQKIKEKIERRRPAEEREPPASNIQPPEKSG
jgi:uncharacterized protein (DUF2062 family)